MKKETLKDKVLIVLSNSEDSRNNDVILWLKVLDLSGYRTKIVREDDGTMTVKIPHQWLASVKQSDCQRVRAQIQNKHGLYLPTNEAVRKGRKIGEEEWRLWTLNDKYTP